MDQKLWKKIAGCKARSELRQIVIAHDPDINVAEVTEQWEALCAERAQWVLSKWCESVVVKIKNCDEFIRGNKATIEPPLIPENNYVAVQKMSYVSVLDLMRRLKDEFDNNVGKSQPVTQDE